MVECVKNTQKEIIDIASRFVSTLQPEAKVTAYLETHHIGIADIQYGMESYIGCSQQDFWMTINNLSDEGVHCHYFKEYSVEDRNEF